LRGKREMGLQAERAACGQGQEGGTHESLREMSRGWHRGSVFCCTAVWFSQRIRANPEQRFTGRFTPMVAGVAGEHRAMTQNGSYSDNVTIPRKIRHV
jgi:hypothetical protein